MNGFERTLLIYRGSLFLSLFLFLFEIMLRPHLVAHVSDYIIVINDVHRGNDNVSIQFMIGHAFSSVG